MASFHTERDVLRRTLIRTVISVAAASAVNLLLSLAFFGTDPDAMVSTGYATMIFLVEIAIVSGLIGFIMSYKSSRSLQRFALIQTELWQVSRTDQLTGLLNRRGFIEAAASALETSDENITAVAFMCDVDRFKLINDSLGHEFGDAVLVEVANLLSAHAKENGMIVGRHGGEEFAGLLFCKDVEEAMQAANSIRETCASMEIVHDGASVQITISIGLAPSDHNPSLYGMIRHADRALYQAKEAGRNRVIVAKIAHEETSPPLAPELDPLRTTFAETGQKRNDKTVSFR